MCVSLEISAYFGDGDSVDSNTGLVPVWSQSY